jgi:hypothetical protein
MANVVLTDLDPIPAGIANDSDLTLVRQGLTDYKCAISAIRNINVAALGNLPSGGAANATDYMLIARGGSNYRIAFNQVGLMKNTMAWFYQAVAPLGWTIIGSQGDRILACSGGSDKYNGANAGTKTGTWQQEGATLSLTQIPNHNHWTAPGQTQSNSSPKYIHSAKNPNSGTDPLYSKTQSLGMVGGQGDNSTHNAYGGCDPHNHGETWRPRALVGAICSKDN